VAAGSHEGNAFSAGLNGGRLFEAGRWVLGPYASLQYTRQHEEGFTESGGELAAVVADRTAQSLVATLGGRIGWRITHGIGEWLPELGIAWLHEHALDDRTVTASYVGAPGTSFTVDGEQGRRDGVQAGLGVSYRTGGFAARLAYRGEFRSGFSAAGLFGGVQYVF
jgi:outer membrane autotransporter protein